MNELKQFLFINYLPIIIILFTIILILIIVMLTQNRRIKNIKKSYQGIYYTKVFQDLNYIEKEELKNRANKYNLSVEKYINELIKYDVNKIV